MIELKNFDHYTESLARVIGSIECNVVSRIVQTSMVCPEQYEFFDSDGWQVGYMRLRNGLLTVSCPDIGRYPVYTANNTNYDLGKDDFQSDECRLLHMLAAIKHIEKFYEDIQIVSRRCTAKGSIVYHIDDDLMQIALEELHMYLSSNFMPEDLVAIRRNGPTVNFKSAVRRLVDYHTQGAYVKENLQKVFSNQSAINIICFIYDKDINDFLTEMSTIIDIEDAWRGKFSGQDIHELYKSATKGIISGNEEDK